MSITDRDQAQVVRKLIDDLRATIGAGYDHYAVNNAGRLRRTYDDVDSYVDRVVSDTQQDLHDDYIDTVWPKCPRHSHPLWLHDGWWCCERDGWRVAALGELKP